MRFSFDAACSGVTGWADGKHRPAGGVPREGRVRKGRYYMRPGCTCRYPGNTRGRTKLNSNNVAHFLHFIFHLHYISFQRTHDLL